MMKKRLISFLLLVALLPLPQAIAQDPKIGSIFFTATDFCPRGSAPLWGATMDVAKNQALYKLVGNKYGGETDKSLVLPDLGGRSPIFAEPGPGTGSTTFSITTSQFAPHSHDVLLAPNARTESGQSIAATQAVAAGVSGSGNAITLSPNTVVHNHRTRVPIDNTISFRPPYVTISGCIWLEGIFPVFGDND